MRTLKIYQLLSWQVELIDYFIDNNIDFQLGGSFSLLAKGIIDRHLGDLDFIITKETLETLQNMEGIELAKHSNSFTEGLNEQETRYTIVSIKKGIYNVKGCLFIRDYKYVKYKFRGKTIKVSFPEYAIQAKIQMIKNIETLLQSVKEEETRFLVLNSVKEKHKQDLDNFINFYKR